MTDRFSEYELLAIVLPIYVYVSLVGYPILQTLAILRMRGWWRGAALVPLVLMLAVPGAAAVAYARGSTLWWMAFTWFAAIGPIAFTYLVALWLAYSWRRRVVQMTVLAVVVAGLAVIASRQGLGWKLGGRPATLGGEYKTEDIWIVTEIARDTAEMSAYANGGSALLPLIHVRSTRAGFYTVESANQGRPSVDLDLREGLWDPAQFAQVATAFLAGGVSAPLQRGGAFESVHEPLLELTAARLVGLSASVSRELTRDMRNASVHEAAALTIGAFALREASGHFQDVRWALGRMTAHLAMARALSPAFEPGIDGVLAGGTLLTLANDEVHARDLLDRLDARSDTAAVRAWTNALRLRVTQDWRAVGDPGAGSRLEKSEYLRARRATAGATRAEPDLRTLGVDVNESANWLRIIQNGPRGLEEGFMFVDASLGLEQREASEVFSALHGSQSPPTDEDLNARATRCITKAGPVVLPWGAWAEFSQRHLAMLVGNVNRHFRLRLGNDAGAVVSDLEMDGQLRNLTMFPVATTFRVRGNHGSDADLRHINAAIGFASASPERITSEVWVWLERAAAYQPVRRGMSPGAAWFTGTSNPYDAAFRATLAGHSPTVSELESTRLRAPSDYALARAYLRAKYGEKIPLAEIRRALGPRLEYDVKAIFYATQYTADDRERLALFKTSCAISSSECYALAALLVRSGEDDEAAVEYARAFADPSFDRVTRANDSGWLVDYYFRHGRQDEAMALATDGAAVGSFGGMVTLAHLDERLGKLQEAETLYVDSAKHYEDFSLLLGFYQRRIRDHHETQWEEHFKTWLPRVFPDGLQPVTVSLASKPDRGVVVTNDSAFARKAGVQSGDIIVGLEGFRVDNIPQYRAINASFETNDMKVTLWRGQIFQATLSAPNRLMGIEFRTYPIQGWGEK